MRRWLLVLGVAALACASPRTGADWDRSLDFHVLGSFAFAEPPGRTARPGAEGRRDAPVAPHVARALREVLAEKGLVETSALEASLWVSFHVLYADRVELDSGATLEVHGRAYAYRRSLERRRGSLVVDLVDPSTGAVVWHGWGYEAVHPGMDPRDDLVDAVRAILEAFPPPARGR